MNKVKNLACSFFVILCVISFNSASLNAQNPNSSAKSNNKGFKIGQWMEISNSIFKHLNSSYVDSLDIDRMMRAGVNAMLEELDPYTIYVPEDENEDFEMMLSKSYGGIGAIIHKKKDENVIINEPYYGSPAWKNSLVCGDEILEIDGESVIGLESSQASEKMKGKPGTTVNFKVKKVGTGEIKNISIVRERIHLPDIEYIGMLNDTTGYILQAGFTDNVSSEIRNAYYELKKQGMKRLILDLRGNGGGLMSEAINIVSLFVPKHSLVVSSKGNSEVLREYKTTSDPIDTEIPLAVLIDGGSASSSEIVAGALQDHKRAVIMGTRSYGKGLVQSVRNIPYNGQLKITTARYYTPSGRCVQALDYTKRNEDGRAETIPNGGIKPDIKLSEASYSRLVYSLVISGVIDQYALEYVRKHDSIPTIEDFFFNEEDYEDFIDFAMTQSFDYRSRAMTLFDQMKEELKKDGLEDSMKDELEALNKAIEIDKENFIRLKKDEIIPFIEEEIAVRYHYQRAGIQVRIRYDKMLTEAVSKF